jgi:MFS family permease
MLLIVATSFYPILIIAFIVLGLSKGALETGLNTFVSKMFEEKRAQYLGFLHAFMVLAQLFFPLLWGGFLPKDFLGKWSTCL